MIEYTVKSSTSMHRYLPVDDLIGSKTAFESAFQ